MEQIKEDDLKKIRELDKGKTITVDFVKKHDKCKTITVDLEKKHDTSKPQYKKNPETKYTAEFSKKDGVIYSYKIIKENNKPVKRENVDFIIVSSFRGFSQLNRIDKLKNSYTTFPNSSTILQTSSSIKEKGGMNSLYVNGADWSISNTGSFSSYGMIVDIPSTNELVFTKTDGGNYVDETNLNDDKIFTYIDKYGEEDGKCLQKNLNRITRREKSAISNILYLNNSLYKSNQKLQHLDEKHKNLYKKEMIEFDEKNKLKKYYWNELFHNEKELKTKCNGLFINLIPENIDFLCDKLQHISEKIVIEQYFTKLNISRVKGGRENIPIKKMIETQKRLFKTDKIMLIDWENNKFDYLPIKKVLQKLLNRYNVLCDKYKIEKKEEMICNIKSELDKINKEEEKKLLKTPISQLSVRNSKQPIIDGIKRKKRMEYCNAIRENLKKINQSKGIKFKQ